MEDDKKTRKQLIEELVELRQCVDRLKGFEEEIEYTRVNREKFSKAFLQNSIPVGITTLKEGRFVDVSDAYLRLMGRKQDEVIGHTSIEIGFLTAEQRELFFDEMNKNGRVENLEMEVRTKGGELRYGLFNAVVMSLADEKYLLTVMTDITMRKRAEEALRESEASRREQEALAKAGEERLILLDNIQTQVWYLTDDHTYGRVNAAHAAFIGVQKEDLAFRSLYDVFPQEVAELCRKGNSEVFHTGEKMHSEEWVPHFSGEQRLLSILRAPILQNDGSVQQIVCSADDITERKRTVEALRESEERYRSLVENANEAIYVAQNGVLKFINRAGFEIAGYSEQDIPSVPFIDVIHPDDRAMMKDRYQKRIAGESFESRYEFRIISKNGEIKWLELNAALINFEGKPATLNFVRDITKRKSSEALLILREEESIMLAKNLEEANIALRVVLSRREGDQKIFDEKIQLNVNEIILPFISSLKSSPLQTRDKHYLDLLEANLKSILSPFLRNMSNTYKNLTPKETQITEMIRQGYNSKDIADMLGTSVTTINTHRNNIRKKLNMKNQKTNLRSHLRSFS